MYISCKGLHQFLCFPETSDREQFQLGTLSHFLNQRCNRYKDLPAFPEVAPDPSLRRSSSKTLDVITDEQLLHGDVKPDEDFYFDEEENDEKEDTEEESEADEDEDEVCVFI